MIERYANEGRFTIEPLLTGGSSFHPPAALDAAFQSARRAARLCYFVPAQVVYLLPAWLSPARSTECYYRRRLARAFVIVEEIAIGPFLLIMGSWVRVPPRSPSKIKYLPQKSNLRTTY
ncbi:hypothetical protein H8B02_05140 [Bradyrhizobium sp. Pear77]|uniref:hypothetical protein n=1 Tax=Bradyrhizobium altum TaxID=1571202 RepID=UPI001E4089A9|nr:hypothetical protein [Bradyrhizobium altum]MCC8952871.1 hypothetical protein [Bradyrhizobium altum]